MLVDGVLPQVALELGAVGAVGAEEARLLAALLPTVAPEVALPAEHSGALGTGVQRALSGSGSGSSSSSSGTSPRTWTPLAPGNHGRPRPGDTCKENTGVRPKWAAVADWGKCE